MFEPLKIPGLESGNIRFSWAEKLDIKEYFESDFVDRVKEVDWVANLVEYPDDYSKYHPVPNLDIISEYGSLKLFVFGNDEVTNLNLLAHVFDHLKPKKDVSFFIFGYHKDSIEKVPETIIKFTYHVEKDDESHIGKIANNKFNTMGDLVPLSVDAHDWSFEVLK